MREFFSEGIQPKFRVELKDIGATSEWIDITSLTNYPVQVTIEENKMSNASFKLTTWSSLVLKNTHMGSRVRIFGGTYDGGTRERLRMVFNGCVTKIKMNIDDKGTVSASVEAISDTYQMSNKDTKSYSYPSKSNPRPCFSGKSSLTLKDIIRGIANDCGMQIGEITLPKEAESENFTYKEPLIQDNLTDWHFLQVVADRYSCSCASFVEDGKEKLFFRHTTSPIKNFNDKIEFRVPTRGDMVNGTEYEPIGLTGVGSKSEDLQPNEWKEANDRNWRRPRILRNVRLEENLLMSNAISYSASRWDEKKNDYVDGVSEVTPEGNLVFWELDRDTVVAVSKKHPEIAKQILQHSFTNIPWTIPNYDKATETEKMKCAKYYYKQRQVEDNYCKVYDRVFRGITLEGTCNLELDVEVQKFYTIRGIFNWASGESANTAYYLKTITHTWDRSGASTQMEFRR